MGTEYFEKLISSFGIVRRVVDVLVYGYLEEYDNDDLEVFEKSIKAAKNMINYSQFIPLFDHNDARNLREETVTNLSNTTPTILANYYINRITKSGYNEFFINENDKLFSLEGYLRSNKPSKKLEAVCYIIDSENNSENILSINWTLFKALTNYNEFLMFLYETFLPLNIDIIPLCVNRNIHFYECDEYGSYLRDLTLKDIPNNTTHSINQLSLPKELDTPKAKELLDKAVEYNLLEDGYKWSSKLLTKKELAYICYVLSNKLGLSSLSNKTDEGRYKTNWKPFKELFNDNNLNNNLRGITSDDRLTDTMDRINGIYDF